MAINADRAQLVDELKEDGESYFSSGVWNNVTDIVLTVSIVVASLIAACLTVAKLNNRWLVALIAGIPAAAASIQTKVGIRERSDWYFFFAAQVRALADELKYAHSPDLEVFAKRRGKLEMDMEVEWKKIARHMPKVPRSNRLRERP